MSLEQRFWDKVEKTESCWRWHGAKNDFGYGRINLGGRNEGVDRAHRVSYRLHFGEIPKGKVVCHSCDNPECTRPDHLFLGTKQDNSLDMIRKGRGKKQFTSGALDPRSNAGKFHLAKTHCPHGHLYSGDNLAVYQGKRNCRECIRQRSRRYRANK